MTILGSTRVNIKIT